MMKVLLAVEPSRISDAAVRMLGSLEFSHGADLFLLYVNPVSFTIARLVKERLLKMSQLVKTVEREGREQARRFLGTIENRFPDRSVFHVHSIVRTGVPGEEILKAIDSQGVDLVVLGARGYSKTKGFFWGSVSQRVLHEASCSVLLARHSPPKNKPGQGMNLLLATDGSPDAKAAVNFLKEVRFQPGSRLTILHVVRGSDFQTESTWATYRTNQAEWVKLSQELVKLHKREARRLVRETRLDLTGSGLTVVQRVAFGNEAEEILKTAKQTHTDLIVLGSRGLTGLKRLFLGSVSQNVVQGAQCSVAVIRTSSRR